MRVMVHAVCAQRCTLGRGRGWGRGHIARHPTLPGSGHRGGHGSPRIGWPKKSKDHLLARPGPERGWAKGGHCREGGGAEGEGGAEPAAAGGCPVVNVREVTVSPRVISHETKKTHFK